MVNIVLRKDMHESFNVKEVWSGRINVGRSREGEREGEGSGVGGVVGVHDV